MSEQLPPREPTTTRIGGGGSAHLAAIGVVVVLLALVWVGWSGRPAARPAAPDASTAPLPVAEATAPTDPATSAPAAGATASSPAPSGATPDPLAGDVYGLTATIDGQQYFAVLRETGNDRFTATVRVPFLRPRDAASVQLHQLWTRAERSKYAELGSWPLPVEALDPNVRRMGKVLGVEVPARPRASDQSLLVRRGFTLEVAVDDVLLFAVLEIDLHLLPRVARRLGEDGRLDPAVDAGRLFVDRDGARR